MARNEIFVPTNLVNLQKEERSGRGQKQNMYLESQYFFDFLQVFPFFKCIRKFRLSVHCKKIGFELDRTIKMT